MIPVTDNVEILRQIVSQLDGIVFTGGEDIQPIYYGDLPYANKLEEVSPARDTFDLMVLKMAADRNIPILGICRGATINECSFRWNFISRSAHATSFKCQPSPKRIRHYPHPSDIHHKGKQVGRNYRNKKCCKSIHSIIRLSGNWHRDSKSRLGHPTV